MATSGSVVMEGPADGACDAPRLSTPAAPGFALLARLWRGACDGMADFVYPRLCPACGRCSDRPARHLCWSCFSGIDLHDGPVCNCCGAIPVGAVSGEFVCGACHQTRPAFDRACSASSFRGVARDLILALKYGRATWLCPDLVDLLHGCLAARLEVAAVDAVVPVPLHPARLRARTYNQSELLARELTRRLPAACQADVLDRVRNTPSQTRLGAAARRANIQDAFAVREPGWVRGRTLLLIDDVMTTGATLHEAARVLKRAGAWQVWAATVARG